MVNRNWITTAVVALMLAAPSVEVSAQGPGGGRGGKPSFDRLLEAFDTDQDDALSEKEVPERVWKRLSQADADGNGAVTRAEFDGYRPGDQP
ncbi:MAG: hypothetical protein KDA58_13325 [Planctomycetaceae bacterium]|nr:hypothetical protein [Planctomycetaceae bacterium]